MLNCHSSHLIDLFLNGAKQTLSMLDAMVTFQDGADLVLEMHRSPTKHTKHPMNQLGSVSFVEAINAITTERTRMIKFVQHSRKADRFKHTFRQSSK